MTSDRIIQLCILAMVAVYIVVAWRWSRKHFVVCRACKGTGNGANYCDCLVCGGEGKVER